MRSDRVDDSVIRAMTGTLAHRGPDDEGLWQDGPFSGGMRRLAIVDLDHAAQPLFNESGTIAVFFNGEIYNHRELRRDLAARGHRFRTEGDGEVISHLYEEYGTDLFEHLDGMFAVALWSKEERRLVLGRDLAGEKPLFWAGTPGGGIAYASETRALRACPGVDVSLDLQAVWDYPTFLWVPEPQTIYQGVAALPHGHVLVADESGVTVRAFANTFNQGPLGDSDEDVVAETRRVVSDAVHSRLLSDVPIGTFLSGGLDSTIVTTLAARACDRLDTFSIGFEDLADPYHGHADESEDAAATAQMLGTQHHKIRVTGADFRRDIEHFAHHGDQPFAVSSGLGILAVARASREAGIKVLLSGDGADELFGGYSWYAHFNALRAAKAQAPDGVVSFQNTGLSVADRLSAMASYPAAEQTWAWHYYAAEAEKSRLFSRDVMAEVKPSLRWFEPDAPQAQQGAMDFVQSDRRYYLPFEMMRKLDLMTMSHSVEGRAPFVAASVLAHANKLSFDHMVRGDTLKWALREAFKDIVPEAVRTRPKHGFNVPIDHWLKNDWADLLADTFSRDSQISKAGLIGPDAAQHAIAMRDDPDRLNGHSLFCFIMLNLWMESVENGNHC